MKLSTMFKVYRYSTAFAGFGLPGLLMEAAKASIRKEVAFQLSTHTPIIENVNKEKHPELSIFVFNDVSE